jgi:hypothetical protein
VRWVDVECSGDPQDGGECRVAFASFDLPDVGRVQPGAFTELLLGQFQRMPQLTHACAELYVGCAGLTCHRVGTITQIQTISPETIRSTEFLVENGVSLETVALVGLDAIFSSITLGLGGALANETAVKYLISLTYTAVGVGFRETRDNVLAGSGSATMTLFVTPGGAVGL